MGLFPRGLEPRRFASRVFRAAAHGQRNPRAPFEQIGMASTAARILIAEDDESLRRLLVRYLSSLGYLVDAFPDGATAVGGLQTTHYDVVITDVRMPGVNGLEVLRVAKQADRFLEVIILTGFPDLTTAVKALREGDAFDYIVKPFPNVEILRATVQRALERRALRQELERLTHQLERQATTDTLTGALNRRAFFDQGEREFARSVRHDEPLALIMVDLDHFKGINEEHGSAAGEAVIIRLAQICREQLRTEDILGRYWADRFVCLLPATGLDSAETAAERIRATLAATPVTIDERAVAVRVSAGVASRQDADRSLDTLVRRAERALRRGKEQGGNRVSREQ